MSHPPGTLTRMRWIPDSRTLELSARNVQVLLDKLDEPIHGDCSGGGPNASSSICIALRIRICVS